jgi:hypothetical protein
MIVPTIDDLKSHGLFSAELFDDLGELVTAKCRFELTISKLPRWYLDRLQALADRSPIEARDIYLADIADGEADRTTKRRSGDLNQRITAPLRQLEVRLAVPFNERIAAATAASDAIDRAAAIQRTIERLAPDAEELRAAINEHFADEPAAHWADALDAIADATPVGDIGDDLVEEIELPSEEEAGM